MAAETFPTYPPTRGETTGRPAPVQAAEEDYRDSEPATAPRIGVEIERLAKAIQRVEESSEFLVQRVNPILAPELAGPAPVVGVNETGQDRNNEPSPVARTISNMRKSMEILARRLEAATARVEL